MLISSIPAIGLINRSIGMKNGVGHIIGPFLMSIFILFPEHLIWIPLLSILIMFARNPKIDTGFAAIHGDRIKFENDLLNFKNWYLLPANYIAALILRIYPDKIRFCGTIWAIIRMSFVIPAMTLLVIIGDGQEMAWLIIFIFIFMGISYYLGGLWKTPTNDGIALAEILSFDMLAFSAWAVIHG